MTTIQVKDASGDPITMVNFGSYRSSLFGKTAEYIKEVNENLPNFQFRDDDVLLCSYPKAGCTWTFEILTMLLKGKPEGADKSKRDTMLEATLGGEMKSLASPRILNTHLPYRRIPADINNKKVKVVFVVRNPKDVAVSLYHMMHGMKHYDYKGKFENWLPLFIRGELAYDKYTSYITEWEKAYKTQKHCMIILSFEDLKKDTLSEVKRLATFLDVHLDDTTLETIAEHCQFKEMQQRYTSKMMGGSSYRDGVKYGFMRKGEVGNWKQWFTVAQNELMDSVLQDELKTSGLKLTYEL